MPGLHEKRREYLFSPREGDLTAGRLRVVPTAEDKRNSQIISSLKLRDMPSTIISRLTQLSPEDDQINELSEQGYQADTRTEAFAQALLADDFIGNDLRYWNELKMVYNQGRREQGNSVGKRSLPENPVVQLALEAFVKTRKELRLGDRESLDRYEEVTKRFEKEGRMPSWVTEEEKFLRDVYKPTQSEIMDARIFLSKNSRYAKRWSGNNNIGQAALDATLSRVSRHMSDPESSFPIDDRSRAREYLIKVIKNTLSERVGKQEENAATVVSFEKPRAIVLNVVTNSHQIESDSSIHVEKLSSQTSADSESSTVSPYPADSSGDLLDVSSIAFHLFSRTIDLHADMGSITKLSFSFPDLYTNDLSVNEPSLSVMATLYTKALRSFHSFADRIEELNYVTESLSDETQLPDNGVAHALDQPTSPEPTKPTAINLDSSLKDASSLARRLREPDSILTEILSPEVKKKRATAKSLVVRGGPTVVIARLTGVPESVIEAMKPVYDRQSVAGRVEEVDGKDNLRDWQSEEFVKALIEGGVIGDDKSDWFTLKRKYVKAGKILPESFTDQLLLEAYTKTLADGKRGLKYKDKYKVISDQMQERGIVVPQLAEQRQLTDELYAKPMVDQVANEAVEIMIQESRGILMASALKRLGHRHNAEDDVSETVVKSLKFMKNSAKGLVIAKNIIANLNEDRIRFPSAVIKNIFLDRLKSSQHKMEYLGGVNPGDANNGVTQQETSAPEQQAVDKDVAEIIQDSITTLTLKQQEVIKLRFFQGLSVAETAAVMKEKEGAIKGLTRRGVNALSLQLVQRGIIEGAGEKNNPSNTEHGPLIINETALSTLTPRQKDIFVRSERDGIDVKTIAQEHKTTRDAIRLVLNRAKEKYSHALL